MYQKNLFQKGVVSDIDNSLVSPQSWVFPSKNIRIMNFEGQGYIVTSVLGNEYSETAGDEKGFKLSSGFIAIGSAECGEILYIISHNPTTLKGEIGCFPSPDWNIGGKKYEYQPLKNLNIGTETTPIRGFLSDIAFNFDLNSPIFNEIKIVPSYDDSVDIIFTDFKNPLRIVNSGFTSTYNITSRMILQSSLATDITLISSIDNILNIDLNSIISGVQLYGNYIYYVRYVDENFNKTVFCCESNPVSIFEGAWKTSTVKGSFLTTPSNKGTQLKLTGLDTKYKYVQFGYTRFYSDESQVTLWENKLIDKYYDISELGTIVCDISGNEITTDFTVGELTESVMTENTCKSISLVDNILFGGRWKKQERNNPYLETISSLIKLKYVQTLSDARAKKVTAENEELIRTNPTKIGMQVTESFADPFVIYDQTGFFHGEAYPFGIIWKYKDNSVSDVYNNLIGNDHYLGLYTLMGQPIHHPNNKGIYRFPHLGTCYDSSANIVRNSDDNCDYLYKCGIEYDFSDVVTYLNLNPLVKTWFESNISGYAAARGERNKNLLYQGISLSLVGQHSPYGIPAIYEHDIDFASNGASIPLLDFNSFPVIGKNSSQDTSFDSVTFWNGSGGTGQSAEELRRFAFFSIDYLLENETKITNDGDSTLYVSRLFDLRNISSNPLIGRNPGGESANWTEKTIWEQNFLLTSPYIYYPGETFALNTVHNIKGSIYPPNKIDGIYCTRVQDSFGAGYSDPTSVCLFGNSMTGGQMSWSNRDMFVQPYLGCRFNTNDFEIEGDIPFKDKICNIYKINPLDNNHKEANIINFYPDLLNTPYYKLSNYISIVSGGVISLPIGYKNVFYSGGDCYVQRSYVKLKTWVSSEANTDHSGPKCSPSPTIVGIDPFAIGTNGSVTRYGHGTLLGIITENECNSAYRVEGEDTTFYPVVQNLIGVNSYGKIADYWSTFPYNSNVYMNDYSTCSAYTGIESFLMNTGYNQTHSLTTHFSYNPAIPYQDRELITRIRYSGRLINGSYINQLKHWGTLDYKDYESQYGAITALRSLYGSLVSIQQKTINEHIVNERQTIPNNQGETLLGTGDILSQRVRKLSDYGSEHNSSIVVSSTGIYGVSSTYGVLWKVSLQSSDSGSVYAGSGNLSSSKGISSKINEYLSIYGNNTKNIISDIPLSSLYNTGGIISGFDNKYKEVLFTFLFRTSCVYANRSPNNHTITFPNIMLGFDLNKHFTVGDILWIYYKYSYFISKYEKIIITEIDSTNRTINFTSNIVVYNNEPVTLIHGKTLVYDEKLDIFIGERSILPSMYITLLNNLYSFQLEDVLNAPTIPKIYQHNVNISSGMFYDEKYSSLLSFVANGNSEQQNTNSFMKHFNSLIIESDNNEFDTIKYETKNQLSVHDWNVSFERPDIDPEYIEDTWRVPITTQTSSTKEGFEESSNMRGMWLKITLQMKKTTSFFIKNVVTLFNISKS